MAAPPKTAEFNHRISATAEIAAPPTVATSTSEALPRRQLTYIISASASMFIPSRNAPANFDLRIRRIKGPLAATKTNAGKKLPIVARYDQLFRGAVLLACSSHRTWKAGFRGPNFSSDRVNPGRHDRACEVRRRTSCRCVRGFARCPLASTESFQPGLT